MIHRLGLSHALGTQKRFVVRTDRQEYQADDTVVVSVEAYDGNFEPLNEAKLPGKKLAAELVAPARGAAVAQPVAIPQLREGAFEARVPVFSAGDHRLRVKDPVTGETVEVAFRVTGLSAERRSAVRNAALESEIAQATGGGDYDLETVSALPDHIRAPEKTETSIRVFSLWNTWIVFGAVVILMLGEWLIRKLVNLS